MTEPTPHTVALESFGRKISVVGDHVEAVFRGYKSGLFLCGPGGVGKSFAVLDKLRQLDAPYKLFNSRMTGKGLFAALGEARDQVHVLEDMERLTHDPDAQGVLRSALWAQPGHPRKVTWTTAKGTEEFEFRGGLILLANAPLANLPELKALATRIEVHRVEVSDPELAAKMRDLAAGGWAVDGRLVLTPETCREVTEELLSGCRAEGCPLDLRLQQKAFQTYRQHAADHSQNHWTDLLRASIREAAASFTHPVDSAPPEVKKARRRNVVRQVLEEFADPKAQVAAYVARAKASKADFYRRKEEVECGEFGEFDKAYPVPVPVGGNE